MTNDELDKLVERLRKAAKFGGHYEEAAQAITELRETVLELQDVVNTYEVERQKALARAEKERDELQRACTFKDRTNNALQESKIGERHAHNAAIEEAAGVVERLEKTMPNGVGVAQFDWPAPHIATAIRELKR